MAERNTFVDVSDGDQLNLGYFNGIADFIADPIKVIYTGTGFDCSQAANGTTTNSVELTTIAASDLTHYNYVEIVLLFKCGVNSLVDGTEETAEGDVQIKVETKDVGGSYATDFNASTINLDFDNLNDAVTVAGGQNVEIRVDENKSITILHTLTSAEKTAGITVKITGTAVVTGASAGTGTAATLTNKRVFLRMT